MRLTCPKCKHAWEQNLTPGVKTQTRCPGCGATFITLMRPRKSANATPTVASKQGLPPSFVAAGSSGPTVVKDLPRFRPDSSSPEVQKNLIALLKLAHHNDLIESKKVQQILQRQAQIITNRDIFEELVTTNLLNAAEFDALRLLLENSRVQDLVLTLNLQEKRGPVVLPASFSSSNTPSSKPGAEAVTLLDDDPAIQSFKSTYNKSEARTLIDEEDPDVQKFKKMRDQSEDQTLLDDDDANLEKFKKFRDMSEDQTLLDEDDPEDQPKKQRPSLSRTPEKELQSFPSKPPSSLGSESATLLDEDEEGSGSGNVAFPDVQTRQETFLAALDKFKSQTTDSSPTNWMPEVSVSLPDNQKGQDTQKIKPPAFVQDEMVTMVESNDEMEEAKAAAKEIMNKAAPTGGAELANDDTFVSENDTFVPEENAPSFRPPSEKGQALLSLLKRRGQVQAFYQYNVEREIARNDHAILFDVQYYNAPHCLKVLFFDNEEMKKKRLKEIKETLSVIQEIKHSNIVEIVDVDSFQEVPFILMQRNMAQNLMQQKEFTPRKLFEWLTIVVQTLLAVYKKGVIHGNLKPRNILLSANERVYLTDFGLFGGALGDFTSLEKIHPYNIAYMPPEYLEGKALPLHQTIDIYSIGVILYELLAGKPPFIGESVVKITYNKRNKPPKSLNETIRLDPNYDQFIQNCMAFEQDHRYPDMQTLLGDLENVLAGKAIKPAKKGFLGGLFG